MPFDRYTRIICTMGPAVQEPDKVRALIRAGMNIARFNFSHGDHAYHGAGMDRVREASRLEGLPVALLLDTKGPEIRTGNVAGDGLVRLARDEAVEVIAAADAIAADAGDAGLVRPGRLTVSYAGLADDVKPGARILIADGLVALEVLAVRGRTVDCRVLDGGEFGSRKNVNVVGVKTRLPAMTEQDKADLRFGAEQRVDFIAASFIRKASDVVGMQRFLAQIGADIPIIAKIEDEEGLDNIEDILRVSAGIMVARGDLGVQVPPERVPLEQKRIIALCNAAGKPVITATQMLESMVKNPRPTRAEAGDVANAILDGSDCVMLSGETASGAYPEAAVAVMDRIARAVEASPEYAAGLEVARRAASADPDIAQAVARAASWTADQIGAAAIVVPTLSGNTARLISRHRPRRKIIAAVVDEAVRRRLMLHWGVVPLVVPKEEDSEAMIQGAIGAALQAGYVKTLDKLVVVAGLPLSSPLMTNSIRVHVIGTVLGRGGRGFGGRCVGRTVRAHDLAEAAILLRKTGGEILVTHTLDETFIPIIRVVDGIILEGVSEMTWELVQAVNPGVVYISLVPKAMQRFESGITVTLDGAEKLIYEGAL
jgi:pyruvate kinase